MYMMYVKYTILCNINIHNIYCTISPCRYLAAQSQDRHRASRRTQAQHAVYI